MKLTKLERETIILFNEQEPTAEISTHNRRLQNRIREYQKACPDEIAVHTGSFGALVAVLPKRRLSIVLRKPLDDEQRQLRSQRMRQQPTLPSQK